MSDRVERKVTIDVVLTPQELATLFANFSSDQQALFFSELDAITKTWGGLGWCGQCAYIAQDIGPKGRDIVLKLAAHLQEQDA